MFKINYQDIHKIRQKSPCQEDRILLVIKVLKKDQISNSKQLYIYIYIISLALFFVISFKAILYNVNLNLKIKTPTEEKTFIKYIIFINN